MSPGTVLSCCLLLCLLIKHLYAQLPGSQEVIADTRWGRIIGLRRKTRALVDYYSFEGVPYALPPLGLLRLAKPVPLIGRTLSPYRAFAVKPSCYGIGVFGPVSEDCLYLDIYVPSLPHLGRRSVMVYFHGGGFVAGIPQPSMDALMTDGSSIVVFVHYRLGLFGFLSAAESFLKGNYGLWDQTMALRWVKTNIDAFDGDPGRVTIFGNSAGAASVAYHVLAPPSKGLFHRAIMLSGSVTSTWAIQRDPRSVLRDVAASVGCPFLGEAKDVNIRALLVTCLRLVKAERLFRASFNVTLTRDTVTKVLEFIFVPVVDGEFVPAEPLTLLSDRKYLISQRVLDKDFIVGVANNEGSLLFINQAVPSPPVFGEFFDNHLVPKLLSQRFSQPISTTAVRAVSQFYSFNIPRQLLSAIAVAPAYSDAAFLIPAIDLARPIGDLQERLNGQGKTFFYYFDHCPRFNPVFCMMHALDALYLFPPIPLSDPSDAIVSRIFIELLTSFTTSGKPEASGLGQLWFPYRNSTGYGVLRLNSFPGMRSDLFITKEKLWLERIPQLME